MNLSFRLKKLKRYWIKNNKNQKDFLIFKGRVKHMKKMKKAMAVTGCAVLAVGFMAGCGSEKTKEALDLNSMTVAQLEDCLLYTSRCV